MRRVWARVGGWGGCVWGREEKEGASVPDQAELPGLLITTPFSQQAPQPHLAPVNMERQSSQSPRRSLSSNGRIKTV